MKENKQHIIFKSMVATKQSFTEMLEIEPQILHISCHGIEKEQGMNAHASGDNKFLLLEKETGEGELVSEKELNKLISSTMPNLDLVFVAACQSEFVGKIFQKCGARHVICVQQDKEVLD